MGLPRNRRAAAVRAGLGAFLLALGVVGAASGATTPHAAAPTECLAPDPQSHSPGPLATRCVAQATAPAPLLAQAPWVAPPLGVNDSAPRAGRVLAMVCLSWLVLLALATVVRPRGWHHKPLFGLRRARP